MATIIGNLGWGHVVLGVFSALLALWILIARRVDVGIPGLSVGFAHLVVAALVSADPLQMALDPTYTRFVFGSLSADHGVTATVAAGAVWVAAVLGAFSALDSSRPTAVITFATSAMFTLVLGVPLLENVLTDPHLQALGAGYAPALWEAVSTLALAVLLGLPFACGAVWAGGRAFSRR